VDQFTGSGHFTVGGSEVEVVDLVDFTDHIGHDYAHSPAVIRRLHVRDDLLDVQFEGCVIYLVLQP
jgi:hypothetical protein